MTLYSKEGQPAAPFQLPAGPPVGPHTSSSVGVTARTSAFGSVAPLAATPLKLIPATDPRIRVVGRTVSAPANTSDGTPAGLLFDWSSVYIEIQVKRGTLCESHARNSALGAIALQLALSNSPRFSYILASQWLLNVKMNLCSLPLPHPSLCLSTAVSVYHSRRCRSSVDRACRRVCSRQ